MVITLQVGGMTCSHPPAYGSVQWTQGDRASRENQVRTRSAVQNENRRIGH